MIRDIQRKLILVSDSSDAYIDKAYLQKILAEALIGLRKGDEIYLIVAGELNRWVLLPIYNYDMDVSKRHAKENGSKWSENNLPIVQRILGDKFIRCLTWENLLVDGKIDYKKTREAFVKLCDKKRTLTIVTSVLEGCCGKLDTITSIDQKSKEKLPQEVKKLIPQKSGKYITEWKATSWENAMAATILEYVIRYLNRNHNKKNPFDIDFQPNSLEAFPSFLAKFIEASFEHQAEETTMLYFCLANYKFSTFVYPNKESPIFMKSRFMLQKAPYWQEVKINHRPQEIVCSIHSIFQRFQLRKSEQEILMGYMVPMLMYMDALSKEKKPLLFAAAAATFSLQMAEKSFGGEEDEKKDIPPLPPSSPSLQTSPFPSPPN